MKTIGNNIQYYRKKKGLSEDDLARYLSVSKDLVISWENGSREPSSENIEKISSFLRINTDDLCDVSEEKKEKIIPVYSYESKGKLIGQCARCGKTIYSNSEYGMGRIETDKRGAKRFVYDPKDNSGDEYFCDDCCSQLIALNLDEKQKEYEKEKRRISKVIGTAIFAGLLTAGITAVGALVLYLFFKNLLITYLVGFSGLLTGYFAFSFTYTFLLRENWIHELVCSYCKSSYVSLFKKISDNDVQDVLKTGFVKYATMAVIYVSSSIILILLVIVLGFISMFVWPKARRDAINALEERK